MNNYVLQFILLSFIALIISNIICNSSKSSKIMSKDKQKFNALTDQLKYYLRLNLVKDSLSVKENQINSIYELNTMYKITDTKKKILEFSLSSLYTSCHFFPESMELYMPLLQFYQINSKDLAKNEYLKTLLNNSVWAFYMLYLKDSKEINKKYTTNNQNSDVFENISIYKSIASEEDLEFVEYVLNYVKYIPSGAIFDERQIQLAKKFNISNNEYISIFKSYYFVVNYLKENKPGSYLLDLLTEENYNYYTNFLIYISVEGISINSNDFKKLLNAEELSFRQSIIGKLDQDEIILNQCIINSSTFNLFEKRDVINAPNYDSFELGINYNKSFISIYNNFPIEKDFKFYFYNKNLHNIENILYNSSNNIISILRKYDSKFNYNLIIKPYEIFSNNKIKKYSSLIQSLLDPYNRYNMFYFEMNYKLLSILRISLIGDNSNFETLLTYQYLDNKKFNDNIEIKAILKYISLVKKEINNDDLSIIIRDIAKLEQYMVKNHNMLKQSTKLTQLVLDLKIMSLAAYKVNLINNQIYYSLKELQKDSLKNQIISIKRKIISV